jgi:transglutaminase/protease-like cytokinesis protein 3
MEYAYEADGSTPENDAWAHNILGVFEKKTGVCEAYSKTFQLLLNYCGVDNIYVTGYATEPHAWNLAKMDDGSWYWFDLTWDDKSDTNSNTLDWAWGIWYNYFCGRSIDCFLVV